MFLTNRFYRFYIINLKNYECPITILLKNFENHLSPEFIFSCGLVLINIHGVLQINIISFNTKNDLMLHYACI